MDQLRRETQPPAGTPPSPVPQYWNPDTEKYERVLGVHGAPRAMLYGPNGQPISTSNRLPVDVGAQVATESTLAEAVSRLNAILTRLEGTLDVDVGGQIHADVDLGDVTVQIGEVQQGKRGQNAEPWEVTLSGRARLVAMGLNEVIPPGVEIFRPGSAEAPVIQAHRRYGFILTFVATPEANRRARVNLLLRRLMPDGSKSGSAEYVMGTRVNVLVADGSPGTPLSLIMEPVHVSAEWLNFGILNTGTEDVTTNWYVVEV